MANLLEYTPPNNRMKNEVKAWPYLDKVCKDRDNNFNLIRMLAATGVLVSHAYPLALGQTAVQPLESILQGITLGSVSVMIFFGISGFLVAGSFERSSSFRRFALARTLRLFPALVVVLVITVLAGAFVTTAPVEDYWPAAASYFLRNLTLYRMQYPLPGVFLDNVYGPAINGSLWTLNHELTCYIGVTALGLLGFLCNRKAMAAALLVFILAYFAILHFEPHPRLVGLISLGLPFATGVAFYVWRSSIKLSPVVSGVLALITIAAYQTPVFRELFSVVLVYFTFVLAYLPKGPIRSYNALGDYSYGFYIYAFAMQQLIVDQFGSMSPGMNMLLAIPLTLICAVLSWNLVERPALGLVHRFGSSR